MIESVKRNWINDKGDRYARREPQQESHSVDMAYVPSTPLINSCMQIIYRKVAATWSCFAEEQSPFI